MAFENSDDVLAHFGVKGMKWGVRKDRDASPSGPSASEDLVFRKPKVSVLNQKEKDVLKKLNLSADDADKMQLKYGPESMKPQHKLSDKQKKLLILGGIGVVGLGLMVGGTYYNYRQMSGNPIFKVDPFKKYIEAVDKDDLYDENFKTYWHNSFDVAKKGLHGLTEDDLAKMSTKKLTFDPGSIFKRVSSVAEDEIKDGGFYAAFSDADINRYKAALPVYWKLNGLPADSGYVVSMKAMASIKAPSPRESFDIWEKMLTDNEPAFMGIRISDMMGIPPDRLANETPRQLALATYKQMAGGWNSDMNPVTDQFFSKVKSAGYNALIDANDAGALSDTPMRLLDGKLFEIAGHETLSSDQIRQAQDSVLALTHYLLNAGLFLLHGDNTERRTGMEYEDDVEDFLAHFGVKGMRWGHRRNDYEGATRKTNREAAKDANEFARAKMFYGDGAGTRRKLIKAQVEAKSKVNPTYKKAFDHHLANQDLDKHVDKAVGERRRKDARAKVGKTARGINRQLNGPFAAPVGAAVLAGAYGVARSKGYDRVVIERGTQFVESLFR